MLAQDSKQINVQLGDVSLTRFFHGNYGRRNLSSLICRIAEQMSARLTSPFQEPPTECRAKCCPLKVVMDEASGLAIAILDDAKILIPLNQASKDYSLHSGKVPLTFYAQLRPVNSDVQSGKVNASATFVLHYD
ncbi:fimbrial protein [Escherichia coli]